MGPFSHKILLGNNGYRGSFDINIKKKNVNIGFIRRFRAITDCWDSWKTFFFQDVFQMQTVGISELGKIIRHIQNKHCFQLGGVFLLKLNLKSFSKNNLKSQRSEWSYELMQACVIFLHQCHSEKLKLRAWISREGYWTSVCRGSLRPAVLMTLSGRWKGITLVTCVRIYLGADSARRYLCPPVTVSVSFRFHSLCNAHSPLNCLERNMKWSSCVATACSPRTSSRHRFFSGTRVQAEYRPKSYSGIREKIDTILISVW